VASAPTRTREASARLSLPDGDPPCVERNFDLEACGKQMFSEPRRGPLG